jgi:Ser/Thr protein kinase RdoA (MazF antagonist)
LAHDLAQLLPQERGSIGSIGRRLARAVERPARSGPCAIHGDFHVGQVLQAGDETVLVDFDRAGLGPAELDVGSFRSHLIELDADPELDQAFLSGYSCRARRPLDKDLSALATAEALFRRAVFSFRRLQLDWPLAMRRTLRRVDHLLAEIGA